MAEIPPIVLNVEAAELAKLDLWPGDVLVFRDKAYIAPELKASLRAQLEALFPGHRCLVLDGGASLEVVRGGPQPDVTVESR